MIFTIFNPKIPFWVVRGAPNPNFALRIGGKLEAISGNVLIGDGRPPRGPPSLKVRKRSTQERGRNQGPKSGATNDRKPTAPNAQEERHKPLKIMASTEVPSPNQWEIITLTTLEPPDGQRPNSAWTQSQPIGTGRQVSFATVIQGNQGNQVGTFQLLTIASSQVPLRYTFSGFPYFRAPTCYSSFYSRGPSRAILIYEFKLLTR